MPLADAPAERLLIVTPEERVSTAEAYAALRHDRVLTRDERAAILLDSGGSVEESASLLSAPVNDFEPVIFPLRPRIAEAKRALLEAGAGRAMLCGSGASVFGVFGNEIRQEEAFAALSQRGRRTGWQVFKCATLARDHYREAFGPCAALLS